MDSGLVFTEPDGAQLHPAWVTDQFHRLAREAGLPPIRLHDLRHGAASLMLAAGVDVKVVSELLGHSGTAITRDIYTSVYSELKHAAAEAVAAALAHARTHGEELDDGDPCEPDAEEPGADESEALAA